MASIHPTSFIDPQAEIASSVQVGPYCIIRGKVKIADNVTLLNNVTIEGPVEIGSGTTIYPGACIGFPPQDVKFKPGMPTPGVKIGTNNLLREHVTIHAASKMDHPTTVGNNCFLMVNSHLGHDVRIGNNVTMVNGVMLGGHSEIGDNVTLGGGAAIHQFCRVGRLAMIGGVNAMSLDIPPFCIAGTRNLLVGLNAVGLRRNGVSRDEITIMRKAFRAAFGVRVPRQEMLDVLEPLAADSPLVREFRDFIGAPTKRGIAPARLSQHDESESLA